MTAERLRPEVCLDLQIQLDRLTTLQEQCRDALRRLRGGTLTREAYAALVESLAAAQKAWEEKHLKYDLKR
jgi:hypothetical protein